MRRFPTSWPYLNSHGILIQKADVDSIAKALFKSYGKPLEAKGLEFAYALLWAIDSINTDEYMALYKLSHSLAFKVIKRPFFTAPTISHVPLEERYLEIPAPDTVGFEDWFIQQMDLKRVTKPGYTIPELLAETRINRHRKILELKAALETQGEYK